MTAGASPVFVVTRAKSVGNGCSLTMGFRGKGQLFYLYCCMTLLRGYDSHRPVVVEHLRVGHVATLVTNWRPVPPSMPLGAAEVAFSDAQHPRRDDRPPATAGLRRYGLRLGAQCPIPVGPITLCAGGAYDVAAHIRYVGSAQTGVASA